MVSLPRTGVAGGCSLEKTTEEDWNAHGCVRGKFCKPVQTLSPPAYLFSFTIDSQSPPLNLKTGRTAPGTIHWLDPPSPISQGLIRSISIIH